jgi:hypothetical protein
LSPPIISLYPFCLRVTLILTNKPTPVAVIQSANGFSHFTFPKSWPIEEGCFPILPSSSGRSLVWAVPNIFVCTFEIRVLIPEKHLGWDILYWPDHQHLSKTCSCQFFLTHLIYSAHSQCGVRICAMVLASRFGAQSTKDFFDAGGVISSLPVSVSESFAIVQWCKIRSSSHAIRLRPCYFSEAASPSS